MNLFRTKCKGTDVPQTLTEKEIQQRLYGHFRSGRESFAATLPSKTSEKEMNTVVADDPVQVESRKDLFSPANTSTRPSNKTVAKDNVDSVATPRWKKDKLSVNTESKIASEIGFDNVPKRVQAPKKKLDAKDHWLLLWYLKWRPSVQSGIRTMGEWLDKLGLAILNVPKVMAIFLYDRRKWFKKSLNWIVAVAIIIGLFSAVNYLNVKRERAMKESSMHPKSVKVVDVVKEQKPNKPIETATKPHDKRNTSVVSQSSSSEPVVTDSTKMKASVESSAKHGKGRFVIQIATYADENDASKVVNRLMENQIPAFIKGFERVGGKVYYSVFIGRFENNADAEKVYNDFKKSDLSQLFRDAFIRLLKE